MSRYGNYPITEEYKEKCRKAKFDAMSEEDKIYELYKTEHLKGLYLDADDKALILDSFSFARFRLGYFSDKLGKDILTEVVSAKEKPYRSFAWIKRLFK